MPWRARSESEEALDRFERGDPNWPAQLAVAVTLLLNVALPDKIRAGPSWLVPAVGAVLLLTLIVVAPTRLTHHSPGRRRFSLAVVGVVSIANLVSLALLIHYLTAGGNADGERLLVSGVVLWATNVLLYSVWYWEFDQGGPVERFRGTKRLADFQFPQSENPELAPDNWRPTFGDYLYTSLTNATAFSPTDTMPLTHTAKAMMATQSVTALLTLGLIIARAVNILNWPSLGLRQHEACHVTNWSPIVGAMDLVFKAMADPTRRDLLDELFRQDGQTLSALEERLPMTRFGVMKHLKVLEEAGLVVTKKRGREKLHFLNPVPIREVHDRWVSKYAEPWAAGLVAIKRDIEVKTMEKVFEIYIKTTPEKLWNAITDPELRAKYTFGVGVQSDWTPGSEYKASHAKNGFTVTEGENLEVDPPNKLVQSFTAVWSDEIKAEGTSRVTWEITPVGDSCQLTVTHDQLPEGANSQLYGGWPMILSGLKTLLETGELLDTPGSLMYANADAWNG